MIGQNRAVAPKSPWVSVLRNLNRQIPHLIALSLLALALVKTPASAAPQGSIAMHGTASLPEGFDRFPDVSAAARIGGRLVEARIGRFDSFNPFTLKGEPVGRLRGTSPIQRGLVFEPLMVRSPDEPFTLYGLLAKLVETPDDRSWVEFTLDERARFQDGRPVTVDDVVFSFESFRDKGRPNHRLFYGKVTRYEITGPNKIRFHFGDTDDRELPLIMALMPVLPKHHYENGLFERADLQAPLGSGPYRLGNFEASRFVTYERNADYWGWDLPVNRGRFNFDQIRLEYFLTRTSAFEAFKSGLVDIWRESDPARWAREYTFPAVRDGRVHLAEIPHGRALGMYGFAFNTRRPEFADRKVREALLLAFSFEWINRTFYEGAYRRTESYFANSDLAAQGPANDRERELLGSDSQVSEAIMEEGFTWPQDNGSGTNRANLLKAKALLEAAGWTVVNNRLVNKETGAPFRFEILLKYPRHERLALTYKRWLERLGIQVSVQTVDSAQYTQRLRGYDFDMIIRQFGASLSPGNEQSFYWGSAAADQPGTRNYPGIKEPAVDRIIEAMVQAESRDDLAAASRALDRALLSGIYVVPLFHLPHDMIAYWGKLQRPAEASLYGSDTDTWWEGS